MNERNIKTSLQTLIDPYVCSAHWHPEFAGRWEPYKSRSRGHLHAESSDTTQHESAVSRLGMPTWTNVFYQGTPTIRFQARPVHTDELVLFLLPGSRILRVMTSSVLPSVITRTTLLTSPVTSSRRIRIVWPMTSFGSSINPVVTLDLWRIYFRMNWRSFKVSTMIN